MLSTDSSNMKQRRHISEVLRQIRESRDYSTRELARLLKMSNSAISLIELKDTSYPLTYIKKLKKELHLSVTERQEIKEAMIAQLLEDLDEA
jgi:transcriptional regulator with XRE-family HTH domain